MKKQEIQENVFSLLKNMGLKFEKNTSLLIREDLKADSLDVLELVSCTEELFDISIESSEIPNDFTVLFFCEIISEKLQEQMVTDYEQRNK